MSLYDRHLVRSMFGRAPRYTICTSATHPSHPLVGDRIYETDTGMDLVYTTATLGWQMPWGMAWGEVTSVVVTSAFSFTTLADITGLTVTFTPVAGRKLRTTIWARTESTVVGDNMEITICDSSNTILSDGTSVAAVANRGSPTQVVYEETSVASSTTRKGRAVRSIGTGTGKINASATLLVYLNVDDIGPAADPV